MYQVLLRLLYFREIHCGTCVVTRVLINTLVLISLSWLFITKHFKPNNSYSFLLPNINGGYLSILGRILKPFNHDMVNCVYPLFTLCIHTQYKMKHACAIVHLCQSFGRSPSGSYCPAFWLNPGIPFTH